MENQRLFVWAALGLVLWLNYIAWERDYAPPPAPAAQVATPATPGQPAAPEALPDLPAADEIVRAFDEHVLEVRARRADERRVESAAERDVLVVVSVAHRIEEALRASRHVHFAWFELVEGDTVLVLHTVYDGPFDAYIQHFALRVGDLFDTLFECIDNPPPMPVRRFPNEFVAHIQRYDRRPAMGYLFSAYPRTEVARIVRDEQARDAGTPA